MLLVLSHVKYLLLGFPLIVMHTIACTHVSRKVRTALGQPPGPKGKTLRLMVSPAAADDAADDAADAADTNPAADDDDAAADADDAADDDDDAADDDAAGNDASSSNARARDLNRLVVRIVENDIDNGVKRRCWHFN